VTLGDGVASSSVDQDDTITASFSMSTPLRLSIEEQTIAPEPSNLVTIEGADGAEPGGDETTLSPDVTRRLLDGSVLIQVANHLPFGMEMRVNLATDSTRVSSAPDVVVGPFTVQPGQIDGATGLVSGGDRLHEHARPDATDLDIFKNQGTAPKPIWGGVELVVAGTGGQTVSVRAGDYVDISALAHLGVTVDPAGTEDEHEDDHHGTRRRARRGLVPSDSVRGVPEPEPARVRACRLLPRRGARRGVDLGQPREPGAAGGERLSSASCRSIPGSATTPSRWISTTA